MLNKIILIGRLTRDVETRQTQNQKKVGRFTLAVDRPYTNEKGERDADFIPVVTWGKLAEICVNNIGKGRLVAVEGRLQIRNYTDKQGNKRIWPEVVANTVKFLDRPKDKADDTAASVESEATFDPTDLGFDFDDVEFGEGDPF